MCRRTGRSPWKSEALAVGTADVRAILLAIPVLTVGACLILWGTGSQAVCLSAQPCPAPADAWQPLRLGGGMLAIAAGSALVLTGLWRHP